MYWCLKFCKIVLGFFDILMNKKLLLVLISLVNKLLAVSNTLFHLIYLIFKKLYF